MGGLRDWWRKLTGQVPEEPSSAPPHPVGHKPQKPAPPAGLEIADDAPGKPRARGGTAGFDPYSSDAGYSKPHSWERVDHD